MSFFVGVQRLDGSPTLVNADHVREIRPVHKNGEHFRVLVLNFGDEIEVMDSFPDLRTRFLEANKR